MRFVFNFVLNFVLLLKFNLFDACLGLLILQNFPQDEKGWETILYWEGTKNFSLNFRDRIKRLKLRQFDAYLGGAALDEAPQ